MAVLLRRHRAWPSRCASRAGYAVVRRPASSRMPAGSAVATSSRGSRSASSSVSARKVMATVTSWSGRSTIDWITGLDVAGLDHPQVRARLGGLGEPPDPALAAHPPLEGPARNPRARHLEDHVRPGGERSPIGARRSRRRRPCAGSPRIRHCAAPGPFPSPIHPGPPWRRRRPPGRCRRDCARHRPGPRPGRPSVAHGPRRMTATGPRRDACQSPST